MAQEILSATAVPLNELSDHLGFASPSYFSAVFKKYAGETPQAFRGRGRSLSP